MGVERHSCGARLGRLCVCMHANSRTHTQSWIGAVCKNNKTGSEGVRMWAGCEPGCLQRTERHRSAPRCGEVAVTAAD